MTFPCEHCGGKGWLPPDRPDDWAASCLTCAAIGCFTIRQLAKRVKMAPKTIKKILDLGKIRPSTGLRLIERLT